MEIPKIEEVELRRIGNVMAILLNRPLFNMINGKMCQYLLSALSYLEQDDETVGVVFASEGKMFCGGADLEEHLAPRVNAMLPVFNQLCLKIASLSKPTAALIHRACIGGGLELARCCRMVVAWNRNADKGIKIGLPEITIGCFPPVGLSLFPRLAGSLSDAYRFLLTGQALNLGEEADFGQAIRLGLVDTEWNGDLPNAINWLSQGNWASNSTISRIFENRYSSYPFPTEDMGRALAADPEVIQRISSHALQLTIKVLAGCRRWESLSDSLAYAEQVYLNELVPHPDYTEGIKATMGKRPPNFECTGI